MKNYYIIGFCFISLNLSCATVDKNEVNSDLEIETKSVVTASEKRSEKKLHKTEDSQKNNKQLILANSITNYKNESVFENASDGLDSAIKDQNQDLIFKFASQLLSTEPKNIKALNAIGLYYFKKGQNSAARYSFEKALEHHPDRSELHSNYGLVLKADGEQRLAVEEFRKAIDINESNLAANINIGTIYVRERDFAKALIALDKAYSIGHRENKFLNNYAVALVANRKFDQALEIYKLVTKSSESNKEALLNMAIVLIDHLEKYKEGLEIINRIKFLGSGDNRNIITRLEAKAQSKTN